MKKVKRCGTCWYYKGVTEVYGRCLFPVPSLPESVVVFNKKATMDATDGKRCECYDSRGGVVDLIIDTESVANVGVVTDVEAVEVVKKVGGDDSIGKYIIYGMNT